MIISHLVILINSIFVFSVEGQNVNGANSKLHSLRRRIDKLKSSTLNSSLGGAQQPFPEWLSAFTGLEEWPGLEPPYIPLDFIDFEKVPKDIEAHSMGVCPPDRYSCSFDCYKCVAHDDVFSCPKLSQTFDDGPSPATPKLLNHLKHKTTFFTLGMNVVRFPDIYQKIQENGHLLASHTWSHPFLPSLSNEQIVAQIEWSIWAMNATGHHIPKWFRPPYGGIDNRVRSIARQFGLQSVLWDYDTFDWQLMSNQRTEQQIYDDVARWIQESEPPSGLILEHDGHIKTVNAAIEIIEKQLGSDQLTVAECVGGIDYIKEYVEEL
ncbi:carbohydrate esterase family 4 protein [Ascoidea rubescens DSM 1968]|uniref:chitin deacetylase n=1 Tax=Ascoidea rubescens DSM 1968 TaxID=1344418 RepID=A0A1D2VK01_9ASCO|nr:carbohydrate esterase family 4 protein [Ascoidea rubescens DSM 1968]ODV61847.1 carbohydrate esterase family 4 protein [Ascoidea rubescens DSM 1968]